MGLSFGSNPLLLVGVIVVLAVLSFFVYRQTTPDLPRGKRLFLSALRFLAISLVAFLIFRPEFRSTRNSEDSPVIAVLVDESESMSAAMTDTTGSLQAVRELVRSLEDRSDVRVYSFGSDSRRTDTSLDSISFTSQRTNIADALDTVRKDASADNLTSVVLISDGRFNTGSNPVFVADNFPVPISTVTVGDTTSFKDIYIQRVETNELAYVDVTLPIEVSVQSNGFKGSAVAVAVIDEQGSVIQSRDVVLPDAGEELIVPLEVTPQETGTLRLRAVVTRVNGESTFRNNTEPFDVRVLKSKKRILVIASRPGPDVALVEQLIAASNNLTATTYIQKTASTFYEGSFTARPDTFDMAVLVGYPSRTSDPNVVSALSNTVTNGMPLLYLYQRNASLSSLSRAFQGRLPIILQTERTGFAEAQPVRTFRSTQHAITKDLLLDPVAFSRLPPLRITDSKLNLAPGAATLFETSVRGIELKDPLVAVLGRPGFRSAVFMGEGIWKWKILSPDVSQLDGFLPGLFNNTVAWLTAGSDERLVRVEATESLYGGGETIQLLGQVYDESLNPLADASLSVIMTGPDGRDLPYLMDNTGNGRYLLEVGSLPEGTYQFKATATADDQVIGTDEGSFSVGTLTLEFRNPSADPFIMRQLSTRSGGSDLAISELSTLPGILEDGNAFNSRPVSSTSSIRLWQQYPFLIIITLLLTTEWFVRKRSGLV